MNVDKTLFKFSLLALALFFQREESGNLIGPVLPDLVAKIVEVLVCFLADRVHLFSQLAPKLDIRGRRLRRGRCATRIDARRLAFNLIA